MTEVKRYNVYDRHLSQGGGHDFEEDSEGDYVTYTDYANHIKELEAKLAEEIRNSRRIGETSTMAKITVDYINHMGDDNTVVDSARVSFDKHSGNYTKEQNEKLIRYLARHKHISPFGHCFASFKVKAPIFVARQLVKHRFLRWNEISRRYVDDEPEFYVPDVWRGRSEDKKQGSEGVVDLDQHYPPHQYFVDANEYYLDLLAEGVAPEQARMVLPQSTLTEWYWSGSLDAFAAMCKLRCAPDTQYESRIVADQISEKMSDLFPVSWNALMENTND